MSGDFPVWHLADLTDLPNVRFAPEPDVRTKSVLNDSVAKVFLRHGPQILRAVGATIE
jgi:hypothetical protein